MPPYCEQCKRFWTTFETVETKHHNHDSPRYAVMGADPAGSWVVLATGSLPDAATQVRWWQAQATGRSRMYFICDAERDGAVVGEEEIDAALEEVGK